jgi:hypothetical protein
VLDEAKYTSLPSFEEDFASIEGESSDPFPLSTLFDLH